MRVLVWFSAGAASAVAAKLALNAANGREVVVAYTNPGSEHPDNQRFIADCERWLGVSVVRLRSEKYRDTWQVWNERRYLNGVAQTAENSGIAEVIIGKQRNGPTGSVKVKWTGELARFDNLDARGSVA